MGFVQQAQMGVLSKNKKNKQARASLKKTLKSSERCPHCKKQVFDLEEHLRCEHSFVCARCGKRFTGEVQWKQHMKDRHGLDGASALRDDRNKKLERWLKKGGDSLCQSTNADKVESIQPMQSLDAGDSLQAPASHRLVCESCGAEAFLPVDLAAQGLSFQCFLIGRTCRSTSTSDSTFRNSMPIGLPATQAPAFAPRCDAATDMCLPS